MKSFEGKTSEVDLYIGKNAGKRIERYIENAKHSIRIVSPYIAESKFESLSIKSHNGVDVRLLTSADDRHFRNPETSKILRKVIIQERYTNKNRKKIHRYLQIIASILLISTLIILGISIQRNSLSDTLGNQVTMYISVGLILLASILFSIARRIKVYTYSYDSPFPVKFVVDPMNMNSYERDQYKDNAFFHVKLFIIDDEIAFLGSVNLTEKGMRYNVESRVTITQKDQVSSLTAYFDKIFLTRYHQYNLDYYGKRIFAEPRN